MASLITTMLTVVAINAIPTVEQLGGITAGVALGLTPLQALAISLSVNILLFLPIYFGVNSFYSFISRYKFVKNHFDKYLERAREKARPYVEKYGAIGITLFVALPGPLTGTYTASLVSWALDLDWKKAWAAIAIGSIIGGILIFVGVQGILTFLKL